MPHSVGGYAKGDVMLITNENNQTKCSTAGLFIISSLSGTRDAVDNIGTTTAPAQMDRLATYSPGGKPGEVIDPTGKTGDCSAHWFTVQGNLVAIGFYEQGVRFLDISDPTNPKQVGYYQVSARAATPYTPAIIGSNTAAAYFHNGLVYVADYARGVDVIKFTGNIPGQIDSKVCWNSCEK